MFPIAGDEAGKGLSDLLLRVNIFTLLHATFIIIMVLNLNLPLYLGFSPSQPLFVDIFDRARPINLPKQLVDYALNVLPSQKEFSLGLVMFLNQQFRCLIIIIELI